MYCFHVLELMLAWLSLGPLGQVDGETLGRVMRTRVVRISNTESVTVLLRPDQCRDTRNAIAKVALSTIPTTPLHLPLDSPLIP